MPLQMLGVVLIAALAGSISAELSKESVQSISHPRKIQEVYRLHIERDREYFKSQKYIR